jgi:outer membrane protein assembly factor BamB
MTALALALALAAGPPATAGALGVRTTLPPAPVRLYEVAWQRPFVQAKPLEPTSEERGGVAVDPVTKLVIFGTRDGWLHAVRPDGTLAWEFRGDGGALGPPAIEGDTVYVGSVDGRLYAVAIPTGAERWRYKADEDLTTRPAVARGLVFVASLQDTLFCVDAATGQWKWHHRRETKAAQGFTIFGAAPAVAGADAVYAGYSDGFVAALDPSTGAVRWEKLVAPPDDHLDIEALALDGTRLYAAAYSGGVVAVDARTGDLAWNAAVPNASGLVVSAGLAIAVTTTSVAGVSSADGSVVWTVPLKGSPSGDPIAAGKWLLVPSGEQGLRWLETATGRTLRVFEPGTGVSGSPAVAGRRVYVLSNGGTLFALDLT